MRIAVVGVTGMVGAEILTVLAERNFPITELIPVASAKSKGKKVHFNNKEYSIIDLETAVGMRPDIALFSAGGEVSLVWAPKFAGVGTTVVDNSSAWRMDPSKKLIIPEVNAAELTSNDKIIASPNCSTIQMLMALAPLHKFYGVKRVVVSTYQSISGTGIKAVRQLENERAGGGGGEKAYPYAIDKNCLPHCDMFLENGYTKEEMKLVEETNKILNDSSVKVTATAVRVPVEGGHSESLNIEFEMEVDLAEIRNILAATPGVVVLDDVANNVYPMPLNAKGKDDVFVGRIRRDDTQDSTINLWVVADNLRKGAATNAVQIAAYLVENNLV